VNEKTKLGAAFLVLLGCGLWLSYYYGTKPKKGESVANMQPLACASCGAVFATEAGELPVECAKCGKKDAHRALKCNECKTIFPLVRSAESFVQPAGTKCTKCGKSNFTAEVSPDDIPK
jgi:DNA-directed RNA polymerase subunit RPC12/RpoP